MNSAFGLIAWFAVGITTAIWGAYLVPFPSGSIFRRKHPRMSTLSIQIHPTTRISGRARVTHERQIVQ